jgi:hypothetical protein
MLFTPVNSGIQIGTMRHFKGGGGTRWRSWLRHCTTSRKVASSIPNGVIRIFHLRNPSGRTMALGSTERASNRNEYQEYFLGVKAAGA